MPISLTGTKVQYSDGSDDGYCSTMTVTEVLMARPVAWCFDCLQRHSRLRTDDVMQQIDSLALRPTEGRCAWCAEEGPVVAHQR
jgi:hypothetical protein